MPLPPRRSLSASVLLALAACALVAPAVAAAVDAREQDDRLDSVAAAAVVPAIGELQVAPQLMAPLVQRFLLDLDSVEHVHDVDWGSRREAALRGFYQGWIARLGELDYAALGLEDRIDWQLLRRELDERLEQLDFERLRYREAAALLPEIEPLIALAEARRNLEYADARASAGILERSRKALDEALTGLKAGPPKGKSRPTAAVANRAARILDATRTQLKQWYGFHAGYDPDFTWWNAQPHAALDTLLTDYAKQVRDTLADAADPETIVGDPIGREQLLRGLQHQLIAYSPEELLELGERELAWCQREMAKAAQELGYADWKQALEHVKSKHVAPGEQPRLVVQLADEAIDYVTRHDLVTVPELARRDWRMTMLDPQAQLQAPFFLGGEDVWVAFPTADMPYDKKLNSLRGNNRHFSRAVVHHELIPGHHLQHFYNARYQAHRDRLASTPFWGEGWALYWEFLLWDRGYAASPEDRIGMLFWRSHRAARILFSLGFHLGKLTPQQAIDLLVERVGHERENAAAEVRRSFAGDYGPLYQVAYMLGGLQFRALHAELVATGRMSDRDFHDAILKGGPMPVELVRARLRNEPPPRDLKASWRFYPLD
jgi:uncharacterized protein (DUF885 family)